MKVAFYPHRVVSAQTSGVSNGVRTEIAHLFAPTIEKLKAAMAFYVEVTKPGMGTEARINRAVALHERFDAEARHRFE